MSILNSPSKNIKQHNKKVTERLGTVVSIMSAALLVGGVFSACTNQSNSTAQTADTREEWIVAAEKHEIKMRWKCEDLIKKDLNDPGSYQAVNVGYHASMHPDPNALVMVKIAFTAKNGFGGRVRNNAVCHADSNGTILSGRFL